MSLKLYHSNDVIYTYYINNVTYLPLQSHLVHPHYLCAQESVAKREKDRGVCVGGCNHLEQWQVVNH